MFVCNSVTRWWSKRWKSVKVVYIPFYREKKYTFFTPCVKYVFDFHRPPPPSFSGFFALFAGSRWRSPCVSGVDGIERYDTLRQSFTNLI